MRQFIESRNNLKYMEYLLHKYKHSRSLGIKQEIKHKRAYKENISYINEIKSFLNVFTLHWQNIQKKTDLDLK